MVKRIPILLYHSISYSATKAFLPFTLTPSLFEQHMAYLNAQAYTAMTVSQYVAARESQSLPEKLVIVTFDDGFEDFYTEAMPILQKYQIPATMYVVGGYVGQTSKWLHPEGEENRPMMDWQQLREVMAAGIEIGAHTMTHPQLDIISTDRAYHEMDECKKTLEAELGEPMTSFAYPHGYHTGKVIEMIKRIGFTSACAVKNAMSVPDDNVFALARMTIFNDCEIDHFAAMLKGEGIPIARQQEAVKTKVWRIVRQLRNRKSLLAQA